MRGGVDDGYGRGVFTGYWTACDTAAISLQREARIALPGIGVFTVQERAARTVRNPANGQEIQIPAKKTAKEIADAVA